MAGVFYRVVKTNPPTPEDFLSYVLLGVPLVRDDAESRRLAEGLSVYATFPQARRAARGLPRLGEFIAELVIPDGVSVVIERTGKKPGHHTLWVEPADAFQWLRSVLPV